MEVRFIEYAREQLRERGLSESQVVEVVRDPGQIIEGRRGRRIAQSRVQENEKEHLLRVVFERAGETATVITAYRTSKVDKYWRRA